MALQKKYEEWFSQSDYDLETAEDLLILGRNIYCVFMCHLSLEKALKGLLKKQTGAEPEKKHDLIYFSKQLNIELTSTNAAILTILNNVSVPTRYPDNLQSLMAAYSVEHTTRILQQTKLLQQWTRQ